ncbi:MAG: fibronectin type III domain-containing protein [Actinomycetota bacterium]|nr:fibronectin type III domain-containing protein [Actinomycetota bacterium]
MSVALAGAFLNVVVPAGPAAAAATVTGYSWGLGTVGQLGNSGTATFNYPVAITMGSALSGKTLTSVAAGSNFACALANAGTAASSRVYCWGEGSLGQLGNATSADSTFPVAVAGALANLQVTLVSAGNDHACALTSTGTVYCWGNNAQDQLGQGGGAAATSNVPLLVSGGTLAGTTVTDLSTGTSFSCAITPASATKTHCWGINNNGQMGDGTGTTPRASPVAVTGTVTSSTPSKISSGASHSCVVATDGSAQCWGLGTSGQLGNSASSTSTTSVTVVGLPSTATSITGGGAFTCAATSAGTGYCWGLGTSGQLGNTLATTTNSAVAVYTGGVLSGKSITKISAGSLTVCAVTSDGGGYCWGAGTSGGLGNQTIVQANEPGAVYTGTSATGPGTFVDISTGTSFATSVFSRSSVPGAPTITGVSAGNASATIFFNAPSDTGGSTIAAYTVTSSSGQTCSPALPTLSCTVTGLTVGTSYSFTVTATNTVGTGAASSPSSPVTPFTTPAAPTAVVAYAGINGLTPVGSSQAVVSWAAPANVNGSAVTSYTVTSSPSGGTGCSSVTAPTLTCTVGSLVNGVPYTFTVTANNAAGAGTASLASSPVTPATVPNPPTAVATAPGNKSATVGWTAPANTGGSPIINYTATASPGGATCKVAGTACTITGLANNTPYTVTVVATNAIGSSVASAPSGTVVASANATSRVTIKGRLVAQPDNKKKYQANLRGRTPLPGMTVTIYRVNLSDGTVKLVKTVTSTIQYRWKATVKVGSSTKARFYAVAGGRPSRTVVVKLRGS